MYTDKYRPKRLSEVIGQPIEKVRAWIEGWLKKGYGKPLLIYGPAGIGKTATAYALANEYGLEIVEMNASDVRDAKRIKRIVGLATSYGSLFGKRRLILIDEVDGIFSDRGGLRALLQILEGARNPILLTANDVWDPRLAPLRARCEVLEYKKVRTNLITRHLAEIAAKEGLSVSRKVLYEIARRNMGDVRSSMHDLEVLASTEREIKIQDLNVLGYRNREENIFEAMIAIFKGSFESAKIALANLDEDPDFILAWIEENITNEYKKKEDVWRAFDFLSKADIYMARILKRQVYSMLKYANDMMAAVSVAKSQKYPGFIKYRFPKIVKILSQTRPEREMRIAIARKIAKLCHVSSKRALSDYLPYVKMMVDKKREYGKIFGLDDEEISFLRKQPF